MFYSIISLKSIPTKESAGTNDTKILDKNDWRKVTKSDIDDLVTEIVETYTDEKDRVSHIL